MSYRSRSVRAGAGPASLAAARLSSAVAALAVVSAIPSRASAADTTNQLVGIHFWGDRNDAAPATMLNAPAVGGWDLEIVNTDNLARGGWKDEDVVDPLYQNFKNAYHVTPITRLGHYWGETLPAPGTPAHASWPSYIANNVAGRMKETAHLWQMGNEPNLRGEAANWVDQKVQPADYAALYRQVRSAIKAPGVTGSAGAHQLLVAPVSPGGVAGDRWIAGTAWLDQALSLIPRAEVDGVALHSYGGGATARASLQDFRRSLLEQLAVVDNRDLAHVPVYLTEWNRNTQIANPADEAVTADFARRALKFIDRWNRTPGNHNVVGTNWFVYDSPAGDGQGWDSYSIEYWKAKGAAGAGDLHQAFHDASRAGYKAGVAGTRPMPQGASIFDDFEGSNGRFQGAAVSTATTGTTGVAGGFRTWQDDTDSYTKRGGMKIAIEDSAASPAGWTVRFVSANGAPPPSATAADSAGYNKPIVLTAGDDGRIGFFLRVYTVNGAEAGAGGGGGGGGAGGLTAQITVDSGTTGGGNNCDISAPLAVNADGEWHWYEWSLDDPGQWQGWSVTNSDGKLGAADDFLGQVSLDSLVFSGPHGMNVEYLLDTVMHNRAGSLNVMSGVPEPGGLALAGAGASALLRRRRRPRAAKRAAGTVR